MSALTDPASNQATSRRAFVVRLAVGSAAVVVPRILSSQRGGPPPGVQMHDSSMVRDTTNLFAMDQSAAKSVQLPPKPGAKPVLTDDQRDDLEHRIRCQCGCTLDVFTCRTTDFSCRVSPAMHRDVMALVRGGYGAQEIIDAFVGAYGERVLMAPNKSGFNLLAWFAPGVAVIVGGAAIAVLLRRWKSPAPIAGQTAAHTPRNVPVSIDATPEELARLEAAVKGSDEPR